MPKYKALRDTLISHESRTVKAGEVFETTFPKFKTGKKDAEGKAEEVDMRLGDNLELVKDEPEEPAKGKGDKKGAAGLV